MSFWTRIVRIFLLFAIGFLVTSIYRTVSAVFSNQVIENLKISEYVFGFATSVYFFFFAVMQIPSGILLDHYGPRRVQSALFLIGGLGSILFGLAEGPILLIIGRLMLGIGMSAGLMAGFTANRLWFNKEELPLLNNLLVALGSLGAILSATPFRLLLEVVSWQWIAIVLGLATIFLAILISLIVPDPDKRSQFSHFGEIIRGVKMVLSDAYFWRIAPLTSVALGIFMSFQSLWLIPYMEHVNQLSNYTGSFFLLTIAIAFVVGPIISGILISALRRVNIGINSVIGGGLFLSIIALILIASRVCPASYTLWFFYVVLMIFSMAFFAAITQHFKPEYAGRAVTALNTVSFLVVFVFQYGFGLIVKYWGGSISENYQAALWICIILESIAFLWFCFGRGKFRGKA